MSAKNTAAQPAKTETPASTEPTAASETPLKKICQELGMDPKKARRLLRRHWRSENSQLKHNIRERWSGDDKYVAEIKAILAPTKH